MLRPSALLLTLFLAMPVFVAAADVPPASVALLVREPADPAEALTAALASPVALTRATAARVALVRNTAALLPSLRETLARETDAIAAREELRALALLGNEADVDAAISAAKKWPSSIDAAVADAVARREDSLELYLTKLGELRQRPGAAFFRVALWRHPERSALVGSRLLAAHDARGWSSLLRVLRESEVALSAGVVAASLDDASEELRNATAWYLVRGYASDPSQIKEAVRTALAQPKEVASAREAFARELLRRMTGGEKKDDPRWLAWLRSDEANRTFGDEPLVLYDWFTDAEYEARRNECGELPHECAMPAKRPVVRSSIPMQKVTPASLALPGVLPAGLAEAIVSGTRCRDAWLGLAAVTVDPAGRVQQADLKNTPTSGACTKALETILKLSLAGNTSITSPRATNDVLLVHTQNATLCLDEDAPSEIVESGLQRTGGTIDPPKVIKRIQPNFPDSAREAMQPGSNALIVIEAVITKDGCVRSLRPLAQTPFPALNGAAIVAMSQWRFSPGRLDGKPVDVIYNLTVNFKR